MTASTIKTIFNTFPDFAGAVAAAAPVPVPVAMGMGGGPSILAPHFVQKADDGST
jgi:hypothetical protein